MPARTPQARACFLLSHRPRDPTPTLITWGSRRVIPGQDRPRRHRQIRSLPAPQGCAGRAVGLAANSDAGVPDAGFRHCPHSHRAEVRPAPLRQTASLVLPEQRTGWGVRSYPRPGSSSSARPPLRRLANESARYLSARARVKIPVSATISPAAPCHAAGLLPGAAPHVPYPCRNGVREEGRGCQANDYHTHRNPRQCDHHRSALRAVRPAAGDHLPQPERQLREQRAEPVRVGVRRLCEEG